MFGWQDRPSDIGDIKGSHLFISSQLLILELPKLGSSEFWSLTATSKYLPIAMHGSTFTCFGPKHRSKMETWCPSKNVEVHRSQFGFWEIMRNVKRAQVGNIFTIRGTYKYNIRYHDLVSFYFSALHVYTQRHGKQLLCNSSDQFHHSLWLVVLAHGQLFYVDINEYPM